jgi:hypothetical protein
MSKNSGVVNISSHIMISQIEKECILADRYRGKKEL